MSYTPGMRFLGLALALSAPFLLSGCEFLNKMFGKVDDTVAEASGRKSAWPALPEADIRNQGPHSGRQLVNAYESSVAGVADAQSLPGGAVFDGSGTRDALNAGRGGVPLPFGSFHPGTRQPVALTPGQQRRSDLRTGEPPGPDLRLPSGAVAADGSARGAGPTLAQYDAFQRVSGLFSRAFDVVSRAGWGAQAPRSDPGSQNPTKVTVHHTDGSQPVELAESIRVVKNIQHDHRNIADKRKGGRWADIGYHFLIDGAGRVFEGRHAEVIGAHAGGGNNMNNVGISLMGDFNKQQMTAPQRDSLVRLVTFLSIKYRRDPSANGFIESHSHYGDTDCPGRNVLAFLSSGELMRSASAMVARVGADPRFHAGLVVPPSA